VVSSFRRDAINLAQRGSEGCDLVAQIGQQALVVGGYVDGYSENGGSGSQPVRAPAEKFNPSRGEFEATSGLPRPRLSCPCGALNTLPWAIPVANLLPDGRVFLAGGRASSGVPEQLADVYDPASGMWSQLDVGCDASRGPQPLLRDGRVLVFCVTQPGGQRTDPVAVRARLFDPQTDTFSDAATPPAPARSAVVLADGDVLLTGFAPMLYHPTRDAFEELQVALRPPGGTAMDIGDGRVLFPGVPDESSKPTSLVYDVAARSLSAVPQPEFAWQDQMVKLTDGRILTVRYRADTQEFDMLLLDPTQLP
jgi:hypothetical protein